VIKTLHVLTYCHDPAYRRAIHHQLQRGETRNSLARDVFHGGRGQLRQHSQVGQENQLGALGLMVNIIVLWQTVYMQAALDHPTINLQGRYQTTDRPPTGRLRPLRTDC
jgi:TnpA family transposase